MALSALIIKARLGLTDAELVEQIKENAYLQFFIGLKAFQDSAPFDPSMMVYFRKRLPEAVINDCNERIVRYGLSVIQSETAEEHDDGDQDGGSASSGTQQGQATRACLQSCHGLDARRSWCAVVNSPMRSGN